MQVEISYRKLYKRALYALLVLLLLSPLQVIAFNSLPNGYFEFFVLMSAIFIYAVFIKATDRLFRGLATISVTESQIDIKIGQSEKIFPLNDCTAITLSRGGFAGETHLILWIKGKRSDKLITSPFRGDIGAHDLGKLLLYVHSALPKSTLLRYDTYWEIVLS